MYIIYMRYLSKLFLFSIVTFIITLSFNTAFAQQDAIEQLMRLARNKQAKPLNINPSAVKIARLHYSGGGDWYWGRSAVPNMLSYITENTNFPVDTLEHEVSITDPDLFQYPFLFATGHGVINFSAEEIERLRQYLVGGGFLFVNDSYGMDASFRKEMAKIFPEREVVELPFSHPIYHSYYDFPQGPPKIHEHDNNPPRGYALVVNGRAVVYFLVESDIGDGWEDGHVHNDPEDKRQLAFEMGLNIITYALLY